MVVDLWRDFLQELKPPSLEGFFDFKKSMGRFEGFAAGLSSVDKIALLLHAYDRYKELGLVCDLKADQRFESSAHSILISVVLGGKLSPSEDEACAILKKAFHFCGHGGDVQPPLTLAERVFRGRPYSRE